MRIARWVLACCLLAVLATGLGYAHAGYRVYIVHTGSMVPTYNPGDVVIDRPVRALPRPGEVITFRHSAAPDVVTHRVTDVTAAGLIHTKGDANATADVWDITPAMVRGSVARGVPRLGYLLVFLRQPAGIGALGCSVIALTLLWSLFFAEAPAPATPAAAGTAAHRKHRASRSGLAAEPAVGYQPISTLLS
jgi:signal peptidase